MKTVKQILNNRLKDIPSISADSNVFAALTFMMERNLNSLVVLEKGKLVGSLHERDCTEKILIWGQRSRETKVREIMRKNPLTVKLEDSLETCIIYLLTEQAQQLPVMDKGSVVGIISTEDILKSSLKRPGVVPETNTKAKHDKPTPAQDDRAWASRQLN